MAELPIVPLSEAAKTLRVSVPILKEAIEAGLIPVVPVGKTHWIRKSQLYTVLTLQRTAEELWKPVAVIRELVKEKTLPAVQVGSRWWVRGEDLEAYISGLPAEEQAEIERCKSSETLTTEEAALRLGILPRAVRGLILRQESPLPATKVGSQWKIEAAAVEALR